MKTLMQLYTDDTRRAQSSQSDIPTNVTALMRNFVHRYFTYIVSVKVNEILKKNVLFK